MINIQMDNDEVLRGLSELSRAISDLTPAFREIGEFMAESTKQRFESQTDPDGNTWQLNKASTLARKGNKPTLTGETGVLMDTINWQLTNDGVEIGSPMEYAAMQQFGGTKSEFPFLWGDIPARPFLGVSDDDADELLNIITHHLETALR